MFGIGFPELLLILIVALLVVGPSRLPQVARAIGKALGEFRRMADDVKETIEHELINEDEKPDESDASRGGAPEKRDALAPHEPMPAQPTDASEEHEPPEAQTSESLPHGEVEVPADKQDPYARKGP